MENKNSMPLAPVTNNNLRESNARRYSQYVIIQQKRKQCILLKNKISAHREKMEQLRNKLKDAKKLERLKKRASASWQTLTMLSQDDKSSIKSAIFMQKMVMEKRRRKHDKLLRVVDDRIDEFMKYYNNRPLISKINDLNVTYELLLKDIDSKNTFIEKGKAKIKILEDNLVKITITMAESVQKYQRSLEANEKQRETKKQIAELESKILKLKIKQETPKNPINFYSDVEWAEYDDIQSIAPMSVASPELQVTPSLEQGPLSLMDPESGGISDEQVNYCFQQQEQSQLMTSLPSTAANEGDCAPTSKDMVTSNIDPEAIINEPPTENYYYGAAEFDSAALYAKSPNPPQSVGSVDFDAQRYAKSPEPPQTSSPEPAPPSPNAADTALQNLFSCNQQNTDKSSPGMFFNFGASRKDASSTFFNLF